MFRFFFSQKYVWQNKICLDNTNQKNIWMYPKRKTESSKATICCFHFKRDLKPNCVSKTKNMKQNKKPNKNTNSSLRLKRTFGVLEWETKHTLISLKGLYVNFSFLIFIVDQDGGKIKKLDGFQDQILYLFRILGLLPNVLIN